MEKTILFFLLQASFAYSDWFVNEPSSFVYDKPEEKAHIEDNLRYGEPVSVLESQGSWILVEYGAYSGWMRKEALIERDSALKMNNIFRLRLFRLHADALSANGDHFALQYLFAVF